MFEIIVENHKTCLGLEIVIVHKLYLLLISSDITELQMNLLLFFFLPQAKPHVLQHVMIS